MSIIDVETIPVRLGLRNYEGLMLELAAVGDSKPIVDTIDQVEQALLQERCRTNLDLGKKHIQAVLDYCWERLNSGYWKDVSVAWRKLYAHASLLKAACILYSTTSGDWSQLPSRDVWKEALGVCDMGLLMGFPIQDSVLSSLASRLSCLLGSNGAHSTDDGSFGEESCKRCKIDENKSVHALNSEPSILYPIVQLERPSLELFQSVYMSTHMPVVIIGSMDHWPALSHRKWTIAYLKSTCGFRTIPVELGARYTDESWSQTLMTLTNFIDKYVKNDAKDDVTGYVAQHPLFEQIPELRQDICIPDYCCLSSKPEVKLSDNVQENEEDVVINAWFGPCGTVSPLHYDPKHNLLAQVVGSKYIRLYGAEETAHLYPHQGSMLSNTSQVDVEDPDLEQFPEFRKACYTDCILREGQMLYIPPRCWHFVRSLSLSFSVSFWWH
ncbi:lysine-specific demethylase 8-like [Corticium candelabrum]|uniref:lysine-specific demethylase 8-like n=1 Tax=Corticium candelabrum TaxID=121492 RepID=UPI002E3067EC|nr:lysine-specific demethylase 8-like [Corticium candelabrum]